MADQDVHPVQKRHPPIENKLYRIEGTVDGVEVGGYTGGESPGEAVKVMLDGHSPRINPESGRLDISYSVVSREEFRAHVSRQGK